VNYTGVVGYSDQKTSHWNMGIYRKSPVNNETLVYNVKDFDMTWGQAGHSTSAPSHTSAPQPEPTQPTPSPTDGTTFIGDRSNNTLIGTSGDDKIYGRAGNDVLTGGAGKDAFAFDTRLDRGQNVDTIRDFDTANDVIHLENAVFTQLAAGTLEPGTFRIGRAALDRDDHIVYDQETGTLSYDRDGSGSASAIAFAKVTPGLELAHQNFFVI
ncbi:MAG TPA: hypothetical protein VEZ16_00990, partial [Microvirga sp.]|nr:hypothetical protein [Microvirga sp.]